MTKENLDNWGQYTSSFLKAADVKGENEAFVCIGVQETKDEKDEARLRLTFEKNDQDFEFDLNKTNANFCKNTGVKSPRHLIGKTFYFKKVQARNPKTKTDVESLRIWKID